MTPKEISKTAFEQVEKEAQDRKVAEVKAIVTETLMKLDETRKEIRDLQEVEKILKLDIEDLKAGKLDLIAERQAKDPKAKKVSVVVIIKEREVIREVSPWYWPYQIQWQIPVPTWIQPAVWCGGTSNLELNSIVTNANSIPFTHVIDCSTAKDAVVGSYSIGDHVVHLR